MAPIKQEEQMKDRLEKRSLAPSPESWASLANRLDAEEKNKNKSMFWWIGIAASIVGILFVSMMYFNNQPIDNNSQIIVNSEENANQEAQQKSENQIIEVPQVSNELLVGETKVEKQTLDRTDKKSVEKTIKNEKNGIVEKQSQKNAVAQTQQNNPLNAVTSSLSSRLESRDEKQIEISNAKLFFENQKIQEVVAQINILNSNGKTISDTEIDSLLKNAQKEILSNRLYNESTRTVDANALLQDVEDDLQQSFRSKVFEALQSGYESVRTAVAERNN